MDKNKVVIVGSGPAGYSAAIYLARAKLSPVLITGNDIGGQPMYTTEIENYAGFKDGIDSKKLMNEMREQAEKFGTQIVYEKVNSVDFDKIGEFKLKTDSNEYLSESVVIATGSESIRLNLKDEDKFFGRGISVCAVCDAALYQDKVAAVVGGGDTACEDSLALAKFANKVYMVVRRDQLRASKVMAERVKKNDKIEILWNSEISKLQGEDKLESIIIRNNKDNSERELELDGVFYAIGRKPHSKLFEGQIKIDERGYIKNSVYYGGEQDLSDKYLTMTSKEGVFAAGDNVDFNYRQVIVAAGMGAMAGLDVERWLEGRE